MINETTEQLIKDSTNLKDLELLLCKTMVGKLTSLEANIQSIIDQHLDDETVNVECNPEELCITLYHELCYLKDWLKEFKNKSQEISINETSHPKVLNLTLKPKGYVMHRDINKKINTGWCAIKDCYLSNNITKDDWRTIKMNAFSFLLKERLENYGYDLKSWNRLKNQRYRAKAMLKIADLRLLHWKDASHRFEVNLNDFSIRYNVCQSNNEEITNLMRTLIYGADSIKSKN